MKANHLKLLGKAQSLERAGRTLEAAEAYHSYLEQVPHHADVWSDYSGQLMRLGRYDEAERACITALENDPLHVSAQINLGIIHMRKDHLKEAEAVLRSVVLSAPKRIDAKLFLAECLLHRKDLGQAQIILEESTGPEVLTGAYRVLRPTLAELWAICGLALLEIQEFQKSEAACQWALQIDSTNLRARANLGSIQMAQGRLEAAEIHLRQLLKDHPRDTNAQLLLITCLGRRGDMANLHREIERVVSQAQDDFIVHKSLAGTYYTLGLWDDYRKEIERYRQVDPDSAYLDFELSLVELLFGDFTNGWRNYEARLKVPRKLRLNQRNFVQPAWDGSPFPGKTLLVWCEQGFGDTLMFIRYLPWVKELGGRVFLEAQPELAEVAATCRGVDLVIPKGSSFPPFDFQVSVMSLPWLFRTEVASIPADVPYLSVPERVPNQQALQACLDPTRERPRIGLVWAGSPGHGRDYERSLSAVALAPLAALPDVAWFSFQLGQQDLPPLPDIVSLSPHLTSFSDTAYALSDMDLLITVDTSIAHLAGALGVPTLLLLSYQPDYRWLLERDDTPWYPTVRLYRQPSYGDWESIIAQVVRDLTQGA